MKIKLIIIGLLFTTIAVAQELDSWWQPDGSLKIENAEHTFRSPIIKTKKHIKENEMVLVNLNNYRGEKQEGINYGIYSKDLSANENTELRVYLRKKIDSSNPETSPLFNFDFTHDNYLIYGCKTSSDYISTFKNQENSWDAYGYYAHGYSFSKTQIRSTDYKHLFNRPKSATWFDTFIDVVIGIFIVIAVVTAIITGVGVIGFFAVGGTVAGLTLVTMAATLAALGFSQIVLYALYITYGFNPNSKHEYIVPQTEFETNMEMLIVDKFPNPKNEDQRNWNKIIDAQLKTSFDCTNIPNRKCYRAPIKEVVVEMKAKDVHLKYVNIPGELYKDLTPYQLFKNFEYTVDKGGNVLATTMHGSIKNALEVFDTKEQILPRQIAYASKSETIHFKLDDFDGLPTYYFVSKDVPKLDPLLYKDLGVYGKKNNQEYRLYRIQIKKDYDKAIAIRTGPDGPFLAGDNIIAKIPDFRIDVYGTDNNHKVSQNYTLHSLKSFDQIDLTAGDSVVFTSKHGRLTTHGIPEIWLARFAGESKYYCTPSIKPDEFRPFLGYDSHVHGVALRKHPNPDRKKTPSIQHNPQNGLYSWYWIAQRRMDPAIQDDSQLASENVVFKKYKEARKFGKTDFPIGGGQKVTKQRNSQMEGYNMQLLYAWKKTNESVPVFHDYAGPEYILGTDPDEIVYIGSNRAKIPSGTPSPTIPKALLKIDVEEWKRLPEGDDSDPIAEMVTAYIENRNYVEGGLNGDDKKSERYSGYEILDKGNYRRYSIRGLKNTLPCNGKPCVKFFQNGNGTDDNNNKAPGRFRFTFDREKSINIPIRLTTPQSTDHGFYGSIEGDKWPSRWQQRTPYSFKGLSGVTTSVLNTLVMEYTNENHLGILTKDTRYFKNGGKIDSEGKWTEHFDIKGWGYNEITVYVQRKPNATMVPIAGMELLEVELRFLSAPGSKWKDFSPVKFAGIDLKEGRGEGEGWYLRDYNDDFSNSPTYGSPLDAINKSYTLSKGDTIVFTAMDSDPHTFFHYDTEWYKTERFMAKRLFPQELEQRIHWFLSPAHREGLGELVHTGRWFNKTFNQPGKYRLTAVYGKKFKQDDDNYDHTRMSQEIMVMPTVYSNAPTADKASIGIYPLSSDQLLWIKKRNPSANMAWRVAQVENIFSKWTHVDGPRTKPPNDKPNRYGLENDYNAHFQWIDNTKTNPHPSSSGGLMNDPSLDWFPYNWVRHYSGSQLPNDMDVSKVPGGIRSTPSQIDAALKTNFPNDTPEPWQWRLPWISITKWKGYRTRTNIKTIFNMNKLFDNTTGAFAGVGNSGMTDSQYEANVLRPIHKLTDQRESQYDFYLDLLSGRKLIFNPKEKRNPSNFAVYQVDDYHNTRSILVNAKSSSTSSTFYMGADMSMIKNLEDSGITWEHPRNKNSVDPYEMLDGVGANIVRFRLWVNPKRNDGTPYRYSILTSVKDEILRAKRNNLNVLLDFHYSDTWTDPAQNIIPAAWGQVSTTFQLANRIRTYTTGVLQFLKSHNAVPDIVQIGNEINSNILMSKPYKDYTLDEVAAELGVKSEQMNGDKYTINWDRNARLINAGLRAVRSFDPKIKTMLHIAGPVGAEWWVHRAFNSRWPGRLGTAVVERNKVDIIGMSYYKGEEAQQQSISTVKHIIENIGATYGKDVLIVETAFPRTYGYNDRTSNMYSDTHRGAWPEHTTSSLEQLTWLVTLREALRATPHSVGFIYWEPFWVGSNTARTKDFIGSNWENMSFFEFKNGVPTSVNKLDKHGGINVFSTWNNIEKAYNFNESLKCLKSVETPYYTSFEVDFGGWNHLTTNDFDWSRNERELPSSSNVDQSPVYAKYGSYYLHTEAVDAKDTNEKAILVSPCFNLNNTASPTFQFSYFMNGSTNVKLELFVTKDDKAWTSIWSESGNRDYRWHDVTVDLTSHRGAYVKLKFEVTSGVGYRGTVAIDNLSLKEQMRRTLQLENRKDDKDEKEKEQSNAEESIEKISYSLKEQFQVYPNPTKDQLTITFINSKNNTVELYDLSGKLFYRKKLKNIDKHIISTKKLEISTGMFIVRVVSDDGVVASKRVIVE